ncbi:MAG TPA: UvrD-helicase domain-containing protein [Rectinemataceae bacterium]|nr:UvrD-helicase domain-containing protein [Rectinemataceae bacterium]
MSEPQTPRYLEKLDDRQRAAATAERNCVVTAGAGAGKTTVLASRYIHLVVGKTLPVRSILALTFTRKAAAEMYERIYGELAAQTSPWAREQLDKFQDNHITTLDSFCAEIVRQAARDFGYSPEFSIDAEKADDLSMNIAYRYVLRNREKPGVAEMLMSFPFDDVAARFFGDLGSTFVTPLALAEKLFSPMKEALRLLVAEKAGAAFERLAALTREIVALSAGASAPRADCASAIASAAAFVEACGHAPAAASDPLSFADHFTAFTQLAMRSYGRNEAEQSIKNAAKKTRTEARNLLDFSEYQSNFPSHCSLFDRLDEFAAEVAEAKRLGDLMDFKDLGACAVHILKRRKDIRAYWKNAIESIMIDEFQDNNELQKDLLYLLAEKRESESDEIPGPDELEEGKLFFVGDEKQSIYRFRGADVAVFKRLSKELSGGLPGDIILPANYRSSAPLIGFFNDFFARVMAENTALGPADASAEGLAEERRDESLTADVPKDFRARYSRMEPGRGVPALTASPVPATRVEYYLLKASDEESGTGDDPEEIAESPMEGETGSKALGADDSLAFEIAQFIKRARGTMDLRPAGGAASGFTPEDSSRGAPEGAPKKADYDDFAILLRTTTNQHRLEKYFRLLDIPFDSESPRGLFRESPANDIYNILGYALDPGDKAAYAAVLRSPLCRASDQAFLELMTSSGEAFTLGSPSEYDSMMLNRAKIFFTELRILAGSLPVSDIVEHVWNQGGLRLDILSRPESHPFLEHFDFLFHLAAGIDRDHGGIADFLARLRPYIQGETEKFDIENVPRSDVSGVKILTIHKSKGLQFPVVILPWVENSGSVRRGQRLWEMLPEGLAVDIKPYDKPGAKADNIFFRLAKDLENEMSVAEIKRLLYVACTRAKDHLFFFGKQQKRSDTAGHSFQYYLETLGRTPEALGSEAFIEANDPRSAAKLKQFFLEPRTIDDVRHWYKGRAKPPAGDFARAYAKADTLDRSSSRRHLNATELNELAREVQKTRPAATQTTPAVQPFPAIQSTESIAASQAKAAIPAASAVSGDQTPIPPDKFGTLCHDAVEKAIEAGSSMGYKPDEALVRDLDPAGVARALELATSMAANFLSSDFWHSLPPGAEKKSEKPFLLRLGEFVVEGRMDLFMETEGEVIVIDFKSDLDPSPSRYEVQLSLYRRAAEGIVPGKKARIGLFWLRNSSLSWLESAVSYDDLLNLARKASLGIGQEYA